VVRTLCFCLSSLFNALPPGSGGPGFYGGGILGETATDTCGTILQLKLSAAALAPESFPVALYVGPKSRLKVQCFQRICPNAIRSALTTY